jgi:hypothetical protein
MPRTLARSSDWLPSVPPADPSEDPSATELEAASRPRAVRVWSAALAMLCLATLWLQFRQIDRTFPYPLHVDEAFISGPAHRIVTEGTLHPYTFNYPSLPKYLAAGAMAAGFIRDAARLQVSEVRQIGNVGYPYYDTRGPMQTARQLFALLSVVALLATGLSAWLAFRRPATILLAPLILVTSPLFFFHSWTYLNVDIVGTCFVMLTIAACLFGLTRPSFVYSAVLPAVFAGLATGSKYTLAVVLLPVLLAIGVEFKGARRIWSWLAAIAVMTSTFLAVVPYSLIDIPGFLNGVASEAFHYGSGHRGFHGEPGLPQLLYYLRHFASEFGVAAAVAAVGVALSAAANWRRAVILTIFPVALLCLLASQRVHFPRNVLSLHPFIAMFAAFGLVSLFTWVLGMASHRGWKVGTAMRVSIAAILLIAVVPVWRVAGHVRDRIDSRNVAEAFLEQQLSTAWTIVVPKQLGFDARGLQDMGRRVVVVDLQSAHDEGTLQALLRDVPAPAVILVPRWGADQRFSGQELAGPLNDLGRRWPVIRSFGTNDVLVNYSYPNPWGDPAFAVATLK